MLVISFYEINVVYVNKREYFTDLNNNIYIKIIIYMSYIYINQNIKSHT